MKNKNMARKTKMTKMIGKGKNFGYEVEIPKRKCEDRHCPFHGNVKLRGRMFVGDVIRSTARKTVVVGWQRLFYLPKYERYEKRRTKVQVHNPACLDVDVGDRVRIVETRPISKTKNFVVVGKVKKEREGESRRGRSK